MPISGLRIILNGDHRARGVLDTLTLDDRVELGVQRGRHVAAVLETRTPGENKEAWRWLNELPGIEHVDVVFVAVDEDGSGEEASESEGAAS